MQRISAKRVLDGAWSLFAGGTTAEMSGEDFRQAREALRRHLRRAWRFALWPELVAVEEVSLRAPYASGTAYALNAEVYNATDGLYYKSLQTANTGHAPESSPTWWEAIAAEDFDGTLPESASWCGPIGDVISVTERDPRKTRLPGDFAFEQVEGGLLVRGFSAGTVWVRYRRPAPGIWGEVFAAGTHTAGQQAYFADEAHGGFEGDWWNCTATSTGSPYSDGAKWERVEIPERLETYLIQAVEAELLRGDGQKEKADSELAQAELWLGEEAAVLAGVSGQGERRTVETR